MKNYITFYHVIVIIDQNHGKWVTANVEVIVIWNWTYEIGPYFII